MRKNISVQFKRVLTSDKFSAGYDFKVSCSHLYIYLKRLTKFIDDALNILRQGG